MTNMRSLALVTALLLPVAAAQGANPPTAQAPLLTTSAALSRLAQADTISADWFTPDFAAVLPSVRGGFKGFASQYGEFKGVDDLSGGLYRLHYAGGAVTVEAALNAQGQLSKLFLKGQQDNQSAASLTVTDALGRLFKAQQPSADWFAPSFLSAVPLDKLSPLLAQLRGPLGAFQQVVTAQGGSQTLQFALGTLPVKVAALDEQGRFVSLVLGNPVPAQKPTLEAALAAFNTLGDSRSVVVLEGSKRLAALNADQKLAVGSAFKLAILAELQAQIKAGQHRWQEAVTLQEGDKSLPSGVLQTWPTGTPLTLSSLAALMISQSDNTATDLLLRVVGRDGVAHRLGLDAPLISTRELFALKNPANGALLGRYLQAAPAAKSAILQEASRAALPAAAVFASQNALAPQVEWFVSTAGLCQIMNKVAALPLTQINSGLADPTQFKTVSFKGGSEVGVLNYTTQVTTKEGRQLCISATVNSAKALDEQAVALAYGQLLQAIR